VKFSSNKWICKLCNTKQSVQAVYGEGGGAYCREIVQKLNLTRGKAGEAKQLQETLTSDDTFGFGDPDSEDLEDQGQVQPKRPRLQLEEEVEFVGNQRVVPKSQSKWAKYTEEEDS
jgi:hypothetical protein